MESLKTYSREVLPHLKKWWFSLVGLPFGWVMVTQYWKALTWDISFSWLYDHPALLTPFFIVIDSFLLIIHEAGHTLIGIFGWRTLTIAGGTLLEVLIPVMIFSYGWRYRQRFTAQLGLLLVSYAWMESAAYAADALERRMPLIGNLSKAAHDFYNLFTMNGLMDHYKTIAWFMFIFGLIFLILFLLWPALEPKKTKTIDLDLDL